MDYIEALLSDGTEISFAVLFIGLLIYNIKTNDSREKRYQETIATLTSALNGFDDLKETINQIKEKVGF